MPFPQVWWPVLVLSCVGLSFVRLQRAQELSPPYRMVISTNIETYPKHVAQTIQVRVSLGTSRYPGQIIFQQFKPKKFCGLQSNICPPLGSSSTVDLCIGKRKGHGHWPILTLLVPNSMNMLLLNFWTSGPYVA